MKNLIFSQDNSIEPNGAIGLQKCGIIFWQKKGFLRHCNELGFQSIITLINKKFLPTNIQNYGDTCFIQFDNDDNKIIFLSLKKNETQTIILFTENPVRYMLMPSFICFLWM